MYVFNTRNGNTYLRILCDLSAQRQIKKKIRAHGVRYGLPAYEGCCCCCCCFVPPRQRGVSERLWEGGGVPVVGPGMVRQVRHDVAAPNLLRLARRCSPVGGVECHQGRATGQHVARNVCLLPADRAEDGTASSAAAARWAVWTYTSTSAWSRELASMAMVLVHFPSSA